MTTLSADQVRSALSGVNDPEIKRPITELGMVDDIAIEGDRVAVTILLTVAGCPMRETLTRDVTAAVDRLDGVRDVQVELGVMSEEQRKGLREQLRGGKLAKEIP